MAYHAPQKSIETSQRRWTSAIENMVMRRQASWRFVLLVNAIARKSEAIPDLSMKA
jgi:hypothetical protein